MKSRLLIASAVVIAAMMLMSPFVMNGDNTNIVLSNVEGGVCINELSVIDGVLCDSSGQAFDVATPILIDDENDLRKLSEFAKEITFSGYYLYLTSDIKMTDEFDPIGNYDVRFLGTFNGQWHTIYDLTINLLKDDERTYAGLFGCIGLYGVVKNLGLINSNISASLTIHEDYGFDAYAGGIAGRIQGLIENCYNKGNVTTTSEVSSEISLDIDTYAYAGGIVGRNSEGGEILNCYSVGDVSSTSISNAFAGGIVGKNDEGSSITKCCNYGIISSESTGADAHAGGIAGYNNGTISNCYNTGNVTGETCMGENAVAESAGANSGGIVGCNENGSISYCYNKGEISATNNAGSVIDDEETTHVDNYAAASGIVGEIIDGSVDSCYNTGNVTCITNAATAVSNGISGAEGIEISNCYNTGNITAISETSDVYVGGIAAYMWRDSTIINCYNTGNVTAISETDYAFAGGITGMVDGDDVKNCYNLGNIVATSEYSYAGGIAGHTYNSARIFDCYNMGTIESTTKSHNAYAGGITGGLDGNGVYCCYNLGDVTARVLESRENESAPNAYAGGIAGMAECEYHIYLDICWCYNTGNIFAYSAGNAYVGGIAGSNGSSITSAYNAGNINIEASGDVVQVGGIAGYSNDLVWSCYNIGNVNASGNAVLGSIVGKCEGRTGCVYYLNETADTGIGQCDSTDSSISLTSEEMKGWNLLGYESEYNLYEGASSGYISWLPDIFNANNGYPIPPGIPIHTQSAGEAPLSAAYVLIGNETTQAENYLKPYTSETPAVEMHIILGDLQNLEGFSSETPTFTWSAYGVGNNILSESSSFTPSEFGTYIAYILFNDENGNKFEYHLLTRTISEAIEHAIYFDVPEDAELTVKDSSGNVVSAESGSLYSLEAGEYTYTVVKEGYKTVEDKLTVTVFDGTVPISLEKETNTIYYIVAAIVVILVVVAIAYFITKKK